MALQLCYDGVAIFIFFLAFYSFYRSPMDDNKLSQRERESLDASSRAATGRSLVDLPSLARSLHGIDGARSAAQ
jgi:hypothetical protein